MADVVVATAELAKASLAFRFTPTNRLQLLGSPSEDRTDFSPTPDQRQLIGRVAYAIPAMSSRVPWRSDCVVQALAARSWLARASVPSEVCIGVRTDRVGFEAHAWLKVGERIVTGGGEINSYAELPLTEARGIPFSR